MGKFDKRAKGEEPVSSHMAIKRRRFEPVVGNTGKETEKVFYAFFPFPPVQDNLVVSVAHDHLHFQQIRKVMECPITIHTSANSVTGGIQRRATLHHKCMDATSNLKTRLCYKFFNDSKSKDIKEQGYHVSKLLERSG